MIIYNDNHNFQNSKTSSHRKRRNSIKKTVKVKTSSESLSKKKVNKKGKSLRKKTLNFLKRLDLK